MRVEMKKNIIISVESRKGGVGKTTAALCISKSFLEKGYAVLLIDTDITGTDIADCADSPFWNNSINILRVTGGKEESAVNLLSLFEDDFMNGNKIPTFQAKNTINCFNEDFKKINILGSQIYSSDGEPTTIRNPAVLFDQLHGYWFVDFLKELVEDFSAAATNKTVAIILDNSPGYIGIAPAIQEWLTDLGPETGKFLIVTSLDSQDMQSCAMAISVLHKQYKEKWDTSRFFLKAKDGDGDDLNYDLMKQNFFMKLTEYEEPQGKRTDQFPASLAFYNRPEDVGDEYSESPEKYLGVVINRVPKAVLKYKRTYQPDLAKNDSPMLNLLGGHNSRQWSEYMVGYDPYIEYQFLQSKMSTKRYKRMWGRHLDRLLMNETDFLFKEEFLQSPEKIFPKLFSQMNDHISQYQRIIDTAIGTLRANELDHLADLIDEDWQPKSILPSFRTAFLNFMANVDHPIFRDMLWEEFEDEWIIEKKEFYRIEKIMHRLEIPFEELNEYPAIKNIIFYLIASLPLPFGRKMPLEMEFLEFFRAMIKIERKLIRNGRNKKGYDLPRILSSGIKRKMSIKEMLHDFEFIDRFIHRSEDEFFDFFQAFTSAQARLMKLPGDSRFLILLIQTMIKFEQNQPNTLPYIKKIAEDVILHKTLPYNAVREKSSSALSKAQFFADFDKAIRNIISRWGVEI